MRLFACLTILVGAIAGAAYGDSSPLVAASGKAITPVATSVMFTIQNPARDTAKTRVFSITGQEIAELSALSFNRFVWDGKNTDQEDVPAGFYVVQIQQNGSFWHGPVIVKR